MPRKKTLVDELKRQIKSDQFLRTAEVQDKDGVRLDVPETAADARKRQRLLVARTDELVATMFKSYTDKGVTITPKELSEVVGLVKQLGEVRDLAYADKEGMPLTLAVPPSPASTAVQAMARGMMEGAVAAAAAGPRRGLADLGKAPPKPVQPEPEADADFEPGAGPG